MGGVRRFLPTDCFAQHPDNDPLYFGLHNRRYKELVRTGLPNTAEGRKKMLESVTQAARGKLFRALYAGRRWPIGYRTLPDGAKEIVCVPRHHFLTDHKEKQGLRPSIDWAKRELTAGSDSYFDIHVVRAAGETEEHGEQSRGGEGRPVTRQGRKGRRARAHLLGPAAREADHLQGYNTSSLRRLIGKPRDCPIK